MKFRVDIRTGVVCFLVATVAIFSSITLSAIVPVAQPLPAVTSVTINNTAGDQYDPHVSGDWVAYTDGLGIRYYNLATNVDAAIPMGAAARDLLSDVSGSRIAFSRVIVGVKTAVMVFDAATPAVAPIEVDPAPDTIRLGAAIGGNTVAYVDFGLEGNGELVVSDLSTLVSTRLTTDASADGNPSVSPDGNVVVWEHCPTSLTNCDIYQAVRSGGTWTVGIATNTASPEGNPDTNASLVVYDSQRAGVSHLFWRPVGGGAENELETVNVVRNPSIAGSYIAFELAATIFDTSDIFVYDVVNNRLFQVTNTPLVTEQLNDITLLPDGRLRVVWASDEDGADARNIKSATFEVTTNYSAAIQAPINVNGSSVFNAKRGVVPVKFALALNGSPVCQLPAATVSVVRTAGGTLGTINETDVLQPSDSGSQFRIDATTCQYTYNLGVSSLGAGTYVVQIRLADTAVVIGAGTFSLK